MNVPLLVLMSQNARKTGSGAGGGWLAQQATIGLRVDISVIAPQLVFKNAGRERVRAIHVINPSTL